MTYYIYVYVGLLAVSLGIAIGSDRVVDVTPIVRFVGTVVRIVAVTPIVGRAAGWW